MGRDQKHRHFATLNLKHSELPNSYMAEILLCVGGSEHDLVGITQKARGWLGNLDNELASCVSSENRLGVRALNSPPAARGEDKWPERFGEGATSLPRAFINEANLILSQHGSTLWHELLESTERRQFIGRN